jgi:hypothetical protein
MRDFDGAEKKTKKSLSLTLGLDLYYLGYLAVFFGI